MTPKSFFLPQGEMPDGLSRNALSTAGNSMTGSERHVQQKFVTDKKSNLVKLRYCRDTETGECLPPPPLADPRVAEIAVRASDYCRGSDEGVNCEGK